MKAEAPFLALTLLNVDDPGVLGGHRVGDRFEAELTRGPVTVGRHPDSEVCLRAPSVGRRAVVLTWDPQHGLQTRDTGSGGGSAVVRGEQVHTRYNGPVETGDTLYVGRLPLRVELTDTPPAWLSGAGRSARDRRRGRR